MLGDNIGLVWRKIYTSKPCQFEEPSCHCTNALGHPCLVSLLFMASLYSTFFELEEFLSFVMVVSCLSVLVFQIENILRDCHGNFVLCDYGSCTVKIMHPEVLGAALCEEQIAKYICTVKPLLLRWSESSATQTMNYAADVCSAIDLSKAL